MTPLSNILLKKSCLANCSALPFNTLRVQEVVKCKSMPELKELETLKTIS